MHHQPPDLVALVVVQGGVLEELPVVAVEQQPPGDDRVDVTVRRDHHLPGAVGALHQQVLPALPPVVAPVQPVHDRERVQRVLAGEGEDVSARRFARQGPLGTIQFREMGFRTGKLRDGRLRVPRLNHRVVRAGQRQYKPHAPTVAARISGRFLAYS